ncbi:hypothetical protein M8J77_008348 [Diaphorina citri]|nr:hypothetical protein M8J77_008348 [Diaphorina citri]
MIGSPSQDNLEYAAVYFNQGSSTSKTHPLFPPPPVSWSEEDLPIYLLNILLVMAGIETNPGPTWHCSVCYQQIRSNTTSVQCNSCSNWCHMKKCTNLTSYKQWTTTFIAECCKGQTILSLPNNLSSHSDISNTFTSSRSPVNNTIRKCAVCSEQIASNTTSVQCNKCLNWCHIRKCTNLLSINEWNSSFIGTCCLQHSPAPNLPTIQASNAIDTLSTANVSQNTPDSDPITFKILQYNCNGLRKKIDEIVNYMETNDILVAAIQETRLTVNSNLVSRDNYSILRKDRGKNTGGGLAFIIHNSVQYSSVTIPTPRQQDTFLEQQAIAIKSGQTKITLVNIYIPPTSSCDAGYHANIEHLLELEDTILLGDFNAHHDLWDPYLPADQRGEDLVDQIDTSQFGILNELEPTRIEGDTISSPDVTLASLPLLPVIHWESKIALSSDHLPITLYINTVVNKIDAERKKYINFCKADWAGFTEFTEDCFVKQKTPTDVIPAEKTFRKILNQAKAKYIPAGCIPKIRPNFPTSAALLADERDQIRTANPGDPRIRELNQRINKLVDEHRAKKWHEHLDKLSLDGKGINSLWKTIKNIATPGKSNNNNIVINFNNIAIDNPKKCANNLNRQFTEHPVELDKQKRRIKRHFQNYSSLNKINKTQSSPPSIPSSEVVRVIQKAKASKAIGPDGISTLMLKHLGHKGIEYMTSMFNLSLKSLTIPNVWKIARIIPLLKPGKDPHDSKSYRPISLLSPVVKLLEATLLPCINENITLASHQHGFRKKFSTVTALHTITDKINRGLNQERPCQRTIMVAVDLSKAFDTISIEQLLQDLSETSIPWFIQRWLHNYMSGRQTYVDFRNTKSTYRRVKQGVPQGGVLSPALFNLYMSKVPTPPEDVNLISYADDCSILTSGNNIPELCNKVNDYLSTLNSWLTERKLQLSPGKSSATLFTTWTKEVGTVLDIFVNGERIPSTKNPKILGITFDPTMTFHKHAGEIKTRVRSRNNLLKSLAGNTWGKNKETILTTYKTIGRPILNYASPIWMPQLSDSQWKHLQIAQNASLRVATGCHKMAHEHHLHCETKILPVKEHSKMLTQQYLISCYQEDHPCHNLVTAPSPPRNLRKTVNKYKEEISSLLRLNNPTQTLKVSTKKFTQKWWKIH